MQRLKDRFSSISKGVRAHLWLTVGLLVVVVLLIAGYNILQALRINASDVGAVSGAVAAVAGALAAFAALGAARQSAATAKDATRALALATKPVAELRMNIDRSQSQPHLCSMTIDIENLSLHPIRGGTLRWVLRDGSSGSHQVGEIKGRLTPSRGMFHRPEGVETLTASEAFDGGIAGVDRVTFDFSGNTREIVWRSILEFEFEVIPDQWSELEGILIPNTKRIRYDRSELEL